MLLLSLFLGYWWLQNTGQQNGVPGEDINYSGIISTGYLGNGTTILVIADGALPKHESIIGRANINEFLRSNDSSIANNVASPELNFIGQASLALAAGNPGVCSTSGVAPVANVSSYDLINANDSVPYESVDLEYFICNDPDTWNVSLVNFRVNQCSNRRCVYIPVTTINYQCLKSCYFTQTSTRVIVAPAGSESTDVIFCPPLRWPLVMTVAGVTNRGNPDRHGAEGAGIFMCAPSSTYPDGARIPSCSPMNTSACLTNFATSNASAAIFAGGISVLISMRYNLTLTDLFYITAFTADRNYPQSHLWKANAAGLWFNRRSGFGRLNLGKAVELARKWKSTGTITVVSVSSEVLNSRIDDVGTIDFSFNSTQANSVISLFLSIEGKDLCFGSLIPIVTSPSGTKCEMKILTEEDESSDVTQIELSSYNFLGESPSGIWTLNFPSLNSDERGVLIAASISLYCSTGAPDLTQISQANGSNPFSYTFNESSIFDFAENDRSVVAGQMNVSFPMNITDDLVGHLSQTTYLFDESDNATRVKIPSVLNQTAKILTLEYVPSVFVDGLKMNLVVEVVIDRNETDVRLAAINLNYTNNYKNGIISPAKGISIPLGSTDLIIKWALNLSKIVDEGYSTSVAISIISSRGRSLINRTFARNTGYFYCAECVPACRFFRIEISPSSTSRKEMFDTLGVDIVMETGSGSIASFETKFNAWIYAVILTGFAFILFCVLMRLRSLVKGIAEDAKVSIEQSERL